MDPPLCTKGLGCQLMRYVTAPPDRPQYKNRGLFWLQSLMDAHAGSDDFQPIDETTAAGAAAVLSTAQAHQVPDIRAGYKPWCPLEIDLDDSASSEGSF
jgi:hypothetical protein